MKEGGKSKEIRTFSIVPAQDKTHESHIPEWMVDTGGGEFCTGKFLPGKIPPGKNSATIVKSDAKNCATLFHGEGQGQGHYMW